MHALIEGIYIIFYFFYLLELLPNLVSKMYVSFNSTFETLCAAVFCAKCLGDMEVQEIHEKINTTENSAMASVRIL
jgi:hypothetical protein